MYALGIKFLYLTSMRMRDYNVETETPEDLRKELLNRGYPESIVKKSWHTTLKALKVLT